MGLDLTNQNPPSFQESGGVDITNQFPSSRDSRSSVPPTSPGELIDPYAQSVTFDGSTSLFGSQTFLGPSQIHNFDAISIENSAGGLTALPLAKHPNGGTKLEIDKHKAKGSDFPKVVGRGYDARHTKFTLMLFLDTFPIFGFGSSKYGANWIKIYTQFVMEQLFPRALEARFAVEVFHPALSAEGITHLVIIERSAIYHVGKQIFHVDVEGIDTRYAQFESSRKGSAKVGNKPFALNVPQKLYSSPTFAVPPLTLRPPTEVFGNPQKQIASVGNGPGANKVGKI